MGAVKVIELVGDHGRSWEEATVNFLAEAQKILRDITHAGIKELDIKESGGGSQTYRLHGELSFLVERD